jgi:DNA-directed RNA polymerase subunit RPC12/RpoP
MEIIACPNCGSKRIYQGTMGDGVLTGYTTRNVCRNCGYQGMPIIFDSVTDFNKFIIKKSKETRISEIKNDEIKKEKKKQKLERPIGISILSLTLILISIISILLYINLLGYRVNTLLWIYYISIFIISAVILPYGLIKGRKWAWTIGGILFAMSIPIGLIFLYYITRPRIKVFFGID